MSNGGLGYRVLLVTHQFCTTPSAHLLVDRHCSTEQHLCWQSSSDLTRQWTWNQNTFLWYKILHTMYPGKGSVKVSVHVVDHDHGASADP